MTKPTDTTTIPQRAQRSATGTEPTAPELQLREGHDGDADTAEVEQQGDTHATEDPDAARPRDFVRQPFGAQLQKLVAPARPGYRRYWFNDEPGRVQRAMEAGYAHVKTDGRNTSRTVGRNGDGTAKVAFLMEIPQRWYEDDVAAQQAKVDEIDAAIKGGNVARKEDDGRYVPKDAISYEPRRAASRND